MLPKHRAAKMNIKFGIGVYPRTGFSTCIFTICCRQMLYASSCIHASFYTCSEPNTHTRKHKLGTHTLTHTNSLTHSHTYAQAAVSQFSAHTKAAGISESHREIFEVKITISRNIFGFSYFPVVFRNGLLSKTIMLRLCKTTQKRVVSVEYVCRGYK